MSPHFYFPIISAESTAEWAGRVMKSHPPVWRVRVLGTEFFSVVCDGNSSNLVITAGCSLAPGTFLISYIYILAPSFDLGGGGGVSFSVTRTRTRNAQRAHTAQRFSPGAHYGFRGEKRAPKRRPWRPGGGSIGFSVDCIYILVVLSSNSGDKPTSEMRRC